MNDMVVRLILIRNKGFFRRTNGQGCFQKNAGYYTILWREYVFDNHINGRVNEPDDIVIREHFGHEYPDNPTQNRGNHFNDIYKNYYDY